MFGNFDGAYRIFFFFQLYKYILWDIMCILFWFGLIWFKLNHSIWICNAKKKTIVESQWKFSSINKATEKIKRLKHRHGSKINFHKIEQHSIKPCVKTCKLSSYEMLCEYVLYILGMEWMECHEHTYMYFCHDICGLNLNL